MSNEELIEKIEWSIQVNDFAKTIDEESATKIADGTWVVNRSDGVVRNSKTGSSQFTLSSDKLALYNTWYNMAE